MFTVSVVLVNRYSVGWTTPYGYVSEDLEPKCLLSTCYCPCSAHRTTHCQHEKRLRRSGFSVFFVSTPPHLSTPLVISANLPPRTILVPFPTNRLASSALRALEVDTELSPLVHRAFSLDYPRRLDGSYEEEEQNAPDENADTTGRSCPVSSVTNDHDDDLSDENRTILRTEYKATTNRMLRVAVNGFMESLGVVLEVMEELDVDVLAHSLERENV